MRNGLGKLQLPEAFLRVGDRPRSDPDWLLPPQFHAEAAERRTEMRFNHPDRGGREVLLSGSSKSHPRAAPLHPQPQMVSRVRRRDPCARLRPPRAEALVAALVHY